MSAPVRTLGPVWSAGSAVDPADAIPTDLLQWAAEDHQRRLPQLARRSDFAALQSQGIDKIKTAHTIYQGDSRSLSWVADESVHLAVTSPPYWTLKEYPAQGGQLGAIEDYDTFLAELDEVWKEVYRVLVPGGRLVVVVGDVLLSRRSFGRHVVFPLHASIQERCRGIGFDNLAPIIWSKIGNAAFEAAGNSGRFLGKPYEPNPTIKNDIEFILMLRKAGGYRSPSLETRVLSLLPETEHRDWVRQIWQLTGASTRRHPAPFPIALAERLVRMYSFVGDTVMDPFLGSGTTTAAATRWGRHSIGIDVVPEYVDSAMARLRAELEHRGQRQLQIV